MKKSSEQITTFATPRTGRVVALILVLISLLGLTVIIGWHARSRFLVQVIPGCISMQYNTALCFVVLAITALLLIKGARTVFVLPGAVFLILMGILVMYQYATATTLGIDTWLFYPWDLTLAKYPGRMAVTSAISFVSSGVGLLVYALHRRSVVGFAVLHTLPLTLGLTSLLGYLAGITFVLPFQLGSQMAVHTAGAFFAYGSGMLVYAWQQMSQADDALPKWAPASGSVMLPVFFLGIGITAEGNSLLGWLVALSAGIIAAVLFGIAAHRLIHSRINQKGVILVSIPLLFILIFVLFVSRVSRKTETTEAAYLHSQEVTLEIDKIFTDLIDAESGVRGYAITGDPSYVNTYAQALQRMPLGFQRLEELVQGDKSHSSTVAKMRTTVSERMLLLARIYESVSAGRQEDAFAEITSNRGLRLTNEFRSLRQEVLNHEKQREANRRRTLQASWQQFNWLIVAGSSSVLFMALTLAVLFSNGISKRLVKLAENARALAAGGSLVHRPLTGTDEIAHLDRVFREMAAALQEASRKERAIFENALDIICSTDAEGRFIKMSPSSLNLLGYQPEEMIGRNFKEFLVEDDVEKSIDALQSLSTGNTLTNFENRYRRKDGSVAHMLWSASWFEKDQVIIAMARDITERKRDEAALRESEERYRVLFEGNPHPIWVYDLETLAFLAVNSAAIKRYGYSREEFLNMTIKDIRPAEDVPALLENVGQISSSDTAEQRWRHRKKNGSIIDVEVSSHQLSFAGRPAEIVLASDITERVRAETAIKQLNQNLESRSRQLEETNKELEAFSYSVSHDLRGPLRAIDGFSRVLVEDYGEILNDDGNRLIGVVRKNAQSMGQLIDDLLAFSRLGRKPVESAVIDMAELAKSVAEELNKPDADNAAQFRIQDLPAAHGDRALIRQVFINLLSNARKYSRFKTNPLIEVGGFAKNGNNVYFVKDNGAGFDMQYVNKLFGVFQRLHGPEEFEGTGVGLAIVQRIIKRHGGEVWAEGKVGEGATFHFSLPNDSHGNAKFSRA